MNCVLRFFSSLRVVLLSVPRFKHALLSSPGYSVFSVENCCFSECLEPTPELVVLIQQSFKGKVIFLSPYTMDKALSDIKNKRKKTLAS